MATLRIIIDGRMAGRTGIGRYVTELSRALAELPAVTPALLSETGGGAGAVRASVFGLWQQIAIPLAARRVGGDLLHVPHFNAPWFPGMPMVVTIHDVAYLDHPQWQPSFAGRMAYRAFMHGAAARSRAILTVSEFCRQRICHHLGVDPGKVYVTPLASSALASSALAAGGEDAQRVLVRQRYAGGAPYVLYVGNIRPHKNVPVLIDAFERARVRLGGGVRLLLVGEVQPGYTEVAQRLNERVLCLGPLADEAIAALYGAAEVFVFPSLYEGFGLSPLEAMAAGCPVICSHAASLPEVVGEAAVTFDPADVDALAQALERVLTDATLQADLVRRGRERAAGFSWARTAAQTADVYRRVLAAARE